MSHSPSLFDMSLMRTRVERAHQIGFEDFLVKRAVEDLDERLQAILRPFPAALDWGTPLSGVRAVLSAHNKGALFYQAGLSLAGLNFADAQLITHLEHVPFAPLSFDLITSLLALQSINDLPGALVQLRRLLKPDGLFIGCLLGGNTLTELRQAFLQAESECDQGVSPHVAPHIDVREMGGLLQRAGFKLPVTDVDTVIARYDTPLGLMHDLRRMGLTNALTARSKRFLRRDLLLRACDIYQSRFADGDGRIRATFEIVWFSGWAEHESQQLPLKPGSAKMSLIDALNPRSEDHSVFQPPIVG